MELIRRIFPNTKQAIEELRKEGESSMSFEDEMLNIRITPGSISKRERWFIFNKSANQCQIELAGGKKIPIRLSIERVIAIYIPADCDYTLYSSGRVLYKILEIDK